MLLCQVHHASSFVQWDFWTAQLLYNCNFSPAKRTLFPWPLGVDGCSKCLDLLFAV